MPVRGDRAPPYAIMIFGRNCNASARCTGPIPSEPARCAIVCASFHIQVPPVPHAFDGADSRRLNSRFHAMTTSNATSMYGVYSSQLYVAFRVTPVATT